MGHADISTTMKHYTGTTDEDSALVRAALADVFGTKTDAQLTRKADSASHPHPAAARPRRSVPPPLQR